MNRDFLTTPAWDDGNVQLELHPIRACLRFVRSKAGTVSRLRAPSRGYLAELERSSYALHWESRAFGFGMHGMLWSVRRIDS